MAETLKRHSLEKLRKMLVTTRDQNKRRLIREELNRKYIENLKQKVFGDITVELNADKNDVRIYLPHDCDTWEIGNLAQTITFKKNLTEAIQYAQEIMPVK